MRAQAELRDPRTPLDAVSLEIPTGRATPAAPTFQAVHVSSPPADAPAVVQQFLESLERRFGRTLVAHTSAYFSASLVGLSEAELLELFSIAANSIVEHHADSAGDTEDGAEDPEQQDQDLRAAGLRATTLQQLLRELRPYLSERAPQVWRWKHAVFEEVSRQRHARYLRGSHLALAAFFSGRTAQVPLILPGLKAPGMNAAPRYNLRVLEELPFQLVHCVGEKQAGWPLQVLRTTVASLAFVEAACATEMAASLLRTLPDIESTLQAELGQYYATQLHTSPTEAAPSPKRPASASRAKGAKKAPNLGLEVLTESRDTKGAADRARQVLDALYRLRNLQRFIKMAQRAEGGWGVVRLLWPACSSTGVSSNASSLGWQAATAGSTVQEALNCPDQLFDSVVTDGAAAVGLELEEIPSGASDLAHQHESLTPDQREKAQAAERAQRGFLLEALPPDARPQMLLRRRNKQNDMNPFWHTLPGPSAAVSATVFTDSKTVAAACMDGFLRLWDASRGALLQEWPHSCDGTASPATAAAVTSEEGEAGSLLASAAEDGTVALWRLQQGSVPGLLATVPRGQGREEMNDEPSSPGGKEPSEDTRSVLCLAFSHDGQMLCAGGRDGVVELMRVDDARGLGGVRPPPAIARSGDTGNSPVLCVAWERWTPGGLLMGDESGHVCRYRLPSSSQEARLGAPVLQQRWQAHSGAVWALAVSPLPAGGFASGSADLSIKLWDFGESDETGCQSTATLTGHTKDVRSLCYHPAGATLASGSEDEQVRLWCVGSEAADVGGAAEGPGTVFACAQILDVDRGTQEEEVLSLAYSADGGYLVTGQSDHAVHMWCVQSASSSV